MANIRYISRNDLEMQGTPCACDRVDKIIFINHDLYDKLTLFQKKFWIWHEKGHINLNTEDEIKADNYAFDHMAGTEFRSLKQIIEAAEDLLDENLPYHQERIDNLYERALKWDAAHNDTFHKGASNRAITAMMSGVNNMILGLSTGLTAQTQVVQSGSQTQQTSGNMLLIGIAAIILILLLLKK